MQFRNSAIRGDTWRWVARRGAMRRKAPATRAIRGARSVASRDHDPTDLRTFICFGEENVAICPPAFVFVASSVCRVITHCHGRLLCVCPDGTAWCSAIRQYVAMGGDGWGCGAMAAGLRKVRRGAAETGRVGHELGRRPKRRYANMWRYVAMPGAAWRWAAWPSDAWPISHYFP